MTQSRSQSSTPSNSSPIGAAPFLVISFSLAGLVNPVAISPIPALAAPAAAPVAALGVLDSSVPAAPSTATAAISTPASAGLPAALMALLRGPEGPFQANEVFRTAPTEPLAAIEETVPAPEWYAITRGRFVGVVDQFALSTFAITGVAHGARKAYTTQALALDAFNRALTWGGVQVA